jgi:hypothetical protein
LIDWCLTTTLCHVKLIIWFSDTAASAKNRPLACIYHQTKINTTVKKSVFKFLRLLTWIDQRETTPISRWRNSEHSCVFLWLYEVVTSGNFRMVTIDKMEPKLISVTVFDGISCHYPWFIVKITDGTTVKNLCNLNIGPICI